MLVSNNLFCSDCGEGMELAEIGYLLHVISPQRDEQGALQYLAMQDNTGGYAYEPQFFHEHCWSNLWEDFETHIDGMPASATADPQYSVTSCVACDAGIYNGETSGLVTPGELLRSPRSPSNHPAYHFHMHTGSSILCISCLHEFNESHFEMWDNFDPGTCEEGLFERCWRDGGCQQGCRYRANAGAAE